MRTLGDHLESVEFVTLWSANLEASRAFYIDRLGLRLLGERHGEFFQFEIAGVPVCVDYHPERSGNESNQIGVRVNDFEATTALLEGMGFDLKHGERQATVEQWASIRDPDGHEVIFISNER